MSPSQLFRASYLWLDLLVGFGSPWLLWLALRRRWLGPRWWRLYWLGAAVGLLWEVPIFVLSAWGSLPIVIWPSGLPVPPMVLMLSHTLWDGVLFLIGVWLVRALCGGEAMRSFRITELGVLLAWGQASELLVELSATFAEAWAWVPGYSWNPVLFLFNGHAITLVPQLIWLAAPVLYYWLALSMTREQAW